MAIFAKVKVSKRGVINFVDQNEKTVHCKT